MICSQPEISPETIPVALGHLLEGYLLGFSWRGAYHFGGLGCLELGAPFFAPSPPFFFLISQTGRVRDRSATWRKGRNPSCLIPSSSLDLIRSWAPPLAGINAGYVSLGIGLVCGMWLIIPRRTKSRRRWRDGLCKEVLGMSVGNWKLSM